MKRQIFIAHAPGEESLAEKLARPLEEAGYEVIHHTTVLVGDSIVEAAQKVLEAGGPVVICATVKATGTRWAHGIANAARKGRGRVFVVHMEEEAYVDLFALGEKVATWWRDPVSATRELVESLKQHYPLDAQSSAAALLHDAERRYRHLALEACDIINLANLPEGDRDIVTRKLELRRLYVPLRFHVQVSSEDELSEARQKELESQRAGWVQGAFESPFQERSSVGTLLAQARRLVVLGDPGAGKSTLIRWLATAYLLRLKQDPDWKDLPDIVTLPEQEWLPIIIRCRDLDPGTLGGSLDGVLRQVLRQTELSEAEAEALAVVFRRKLDRGEALLLIDGLDEISEPRARIRFCEQLERIRVAFPTAPIVVTSRIVGYREIGGHRMARGFEHVTVDALSPEDKDDFVRRWCAMTEPPERQTSIAEELIHDIHSTDRIERLTGNPMLLTTMALVKRKVGKLPRRRADLYGEAVQVLLNWRRAETRDPLELGEALPQLEYLAYAMCDRGVQRLQRDEVLALLAQHRTEYPNLHLVRNHSPEQFLALLERHTGILVEAGHEKHLGMPVPIYEFRHLTFQEFLAARALVNRCFPAAPVRPLAENVAPLVGKLKVVDEHSAWGEQISSSWSEVLRLCVTLCRNDDVDSVLSAILEPLPGEDALVAFVRADEAALCLVDEPNVSEEIARKILLTLAQRIAFELGDEQPWLSDIVLANHLPVITMLKETRWARETSRALVHEFRRREPFARDVIHGLWRSSYSPQAGHSLLGDFSACVSLLASTDEIEAIEAALTLASWWSQSSELLPAIDGEALMALVERGGAVAHAAAMALENLGNMLGARRVWSPTPAQLERLVAVLASETLDAGAVISLMGVLSHEGAKRAVVPMVTRLKSPLPQVRSAAALALGTVHAASAVEPLSQALEDPEPEVRRQAVTALGILRAPQTVGLLSESVRDPDAKVRMAAVAALSHFPGPEPLAALREASADPDIDVRRELVRYLAERGNPDDASVLGLMLDDSDLWLRLEVIRTLRELKSPLAASLLLAFLKQEPSGAHGR